MVPNALRGRWRSRAAYGIGLFGLITLLSTALIGMRAHDAVRAAADVPHTEVAVVFGAGLRDGEPSSSLARRLDTAAQLYRDGRIEVVLVSGDNSRTDHDEPTAMRGYLVARGVPDRRIVSDFAGFDTWDSCARARRVFGVDRAVLISQDFHIARAVALCRAAGVAGYGVGAGDPRDSVWLYGVLRENVADVKAVLDLAVRPAPHFPGPADPAVTTALAMAGAEAYAPLPLHRHGR